MKDYGGQNEDIRVVGVVGVDPEEKTETIFIEVMTESFPELMKDKNPQIKETLQVMSRSNKNNSHLKLQITKDRRGP